MIQKSSLAENLRSVSMVLTSDSQGGIGLQALAQVWFEAIDDTRRRRALLVGRRLQPFGDVGPDGLSVDADLPGDGAHGQALAMQIQDHDEFPKFDHRVLPPARRRSLGDSAVTKTGEISNVTSAENCSATDTECPAGRVMHCPGESVFAALLDQAEVVKRLWRAAERAEKSQKDPADQRHEAAEAHRLDQEITGTPFVEDGSH
jgi:hypothetical protein